MNLNIQNMFFSRRRLKSIDLTDFDTSVIINASKLFNQCYNLNMENLVFNCCTNANDMFKDCNNLTNGLKLNN